MLSTDLNSHIEYMETFNNILNDPNYDINNHIDFFTNNLNDKHNYINTNKENIINANKRELLNKYLENYNKHKNEIYELIKKSKIIDNPIINNVQLNVINKGERFIKNAMFSTFLGFIFASFFTFRGDEFD